MLPITATGANSPLVNPNNIESVSGSKAKRVEDDLHWLWINQMVRLKKHLDQEYARRHPLETSKNFLAHN